MAAIERLRTLECVSREKNPGESHKNWGTAGFTKGQSGNPGGRPKTVKVLMDAGFDPKELRKEVVQNAVKVMRDGHEDDGPSWRYAHDYLAGLLGIRPKREVAIEDSREEASSDAIAWETVSVEERRALLAAADRLVELASDEPTEH